MNAILVKDQTVGGDSINEIELQFESDMITVRDLITSRVNAEVEIYNKNIETKYAGLVIPKKVEELLYKEGTKYSNRKVDFEKQVYVALDGFMKNQFFIIINDKQAEDLEEAIDAKSVSEVEFIKLTPLVGG